MKGSAKAPKVDYKGLWNKYQGWAKEDLDWYDQTISSEKARLGSSGISSISPEWDRRLSIIEEQYIEKQETLKQGATVQQLMKGTAGGNDAKMFALGGLAAVHSNSPSKAFQRMPKKASSIGEMERYWSKKYGNIEGYAGNGNKVNYQRSVLAKGQDTGAPSIAEARKKYTSPKARTGPTGALATAAYNPWMKFTA